MANLNLPGGAVGVSILITPLTPGLVSLIDLPANSTITSAVLQVLTPFDGAPTFELGIPADTDLVLRDSDVKLDTTARYTTAVLHRILGSTTLNVVFAFGGSTTGQARLTATVITGD